MIEQIVTQTFDKRIAQVFGEKEDIKRFLLNHERKPIVINNICAQIRGIELVSKSFNINKLIEVVCSLADLFAQTCLKVKEGELLTDAEKRRQEAQKDYYKTLEAEISELGKEATSTSTTFFAHKV